MSRLWIIAALAMIYGCHRFSSPTDPMPFPCDGTVHALSREETRNIQAAAVQEMRDAISKGTLTGRDLDRLNRSFPRVDYVACDFVYQGVWCAGLTDYEAWRIKVKTNEPQRTAPLVRWETINAYLDAIGRVDLTDTWQGQNR